MPGSGLRSPTPSGLLAVTLLQERLLLASTASQQKPEAGQVIVRPVGRKKVYQRRTYPEESAEYHYPPPSEAVRKYSSWELEEEPR